MSVREVSFSFSSFLYKSIAARVLRTRKRTLSITRSPIIASYAHPRFVANVEKLFCYAARLICFEFVFERHNSTNTDGEQRRSKNENKR